MRSFASAQTSAEAQRFNRLVWASSYLAVVVGGLAIATVVRHRLFQPYLGLTLAALALLVTLWVFRPRVALYATLFLTPIGDISTQSWFPFTKNLSSRESIAFVSDAATISPLEISLLVGLIVTVLRRFARTRRFFAPSPLLWPLMAFIGFVMVGFARGIVRGGDLRIAVLEGRGVLYILAMFAVVTSECREPRHLRIALGWVLAGITVHALLALDYLLGLPPERRAALDSLTEHGASLAMNLILVAAFVTALLEGIPRVVPALLAVGSIPVVWVYLVSQRRAGVASLAVAVVVLFILLYWRQRRTFWKVVPLVAVITAVYLAAFWTSNSMLGFPAQAIKTVIAPGQASAEDQASDLYRIAENFDVNFTVRSAPIFGLGFGHPFYRPLPLPGITPFDLAAYVPHNSLLWVWIKTGFGGFVALFYLISKSLVVGTDKIRRMTGGADLVVAICGMLFVVMFTVFTYVDISWDVRNTPILGFALAVCSLPHGLGRNRTSAVTRQSDAGRTTTLATSAASRSA